MLQVFKKNITIEKLQQEADSMILKDQDKKYFIAYPEFISFFQNIHQLYKSSNKKANGEEVANHVSYRS